MWELLGWHQTTDSHYNSSRKGILSSIYLLQFIQPGDKLDTVRWAIMKPSWETTRNRNRMKEHRSSTISSLRALLDETSQMLHSNMCLRSLFQNAWHYAMHGVHNLVCTYSTDEVTVFALHAIIRNIQSSVLRIEGPIIYPPEYILFISAVFPAIVEDLLYDSEHIVVEQPC